MSSAFSPLPWETSHEPESRHMMRRRENTSVRANGFAIRWRRVLLRSVELSSSVDRWRRQGKAQCPFFFLSRRYSPVSLAGSSPSLLSDALPPPSLLPSPSLATPSSLSTTLLLPSFKSSASNLELFPSPAFTSSVPSLRQNRITLGSGRKHRRTA